MAIVRLGTANPTSQETAGGLPESLSLTGWSVSYHDGGATFRSVGSQVPPPQQSSVTITLDETNHVTSAIYSRATLSSQFPQFQITGLSIPLATFLANLNNIMPPLVAGNDTIYGNAFDNVLNGQAGDDVIYGYAGQDKLAGGDGNDVLYGGDGTDRLAGGDGNDWFSPGRRNPAFVSDVVNGGSGSDTVSFSGDNIAVTVNLTSGTAIETGHNADTGRISAQLSSIENAVGGTQGDTLVGSSANNRLSGGGGSDALTGYDGDDVLLGGGGNDRLAGDFGADTLDGGAGTDVANYAKSIAGVEVNLATGFGYGGYAAGDRLSNIENVIGSNYNDILIGSSSANQISGGLGNDNLYGGAGNDLLDASKGDDAVFGGDGTDTLLGGDGNDGLFGEAGDDVVYAGNGNDYIEGGAGNDVLWGEAGNDNVLGGAGDDFFVLGAGDDNFTLGTGADLVRFDFGNGDDTLTDFGNGNDAVDFTWTNVTLAQLQANTTETSAGVLIELGTGSILLAGLNLSQIDWSSDFVFA
jgi:Ca2+-binding RTX toxin-like protein